MSRDEPKWLVKLSNPADAKRFTATPTRYFDVSDDCSELVELTVADLDDLRHGFTSAWSVGTRLSAGSQAGTIESIDYETGVITMRVDASGASG